jgi:hypothetical protein
MQKGPVILAEAEKLRAGAVDIYMRCSLYAGSRFF